MDADRQALAQARDILRGDESDRSDRDTLTALWRLLLPDECESNGTEKQERPHEVESRWRRSHQALFLGPVAVSWGWKWAFRFKLAHSGSSYRLCVLGVMVEVVL